jgi:hypothetical protein
MTQVPGDGPAPRLLMSERLPAYAHLPGVTPHPLNDPRGHSHGQTNDPPPVDPGCWRESRAYLLGLDLFNAGYFWEAHEVWEGLWKAAGRRGETADFLKGLIQLAVAGLKQRQGLPDRVKARAQRAAQLWRGVRQERFLGFTVAALVEVAEAVGREGWPGRPVVLWPEEDEAG